MSTKKIVAEKMKKIDWESKGISMTELEERIDRKFYVPGVIQEKTHVVLFGNSGTGKTTIGFFLMKKILDENPGVKIMYFLLDGADLIAYNARNFIPNDRLTIIMNENAQDILNDINSEVKARVDLRGTIYVFDTYKKFQNDVNSKKANTQHLDLIRKVTALGATCISIAHTNKDGGTFSGNAEIEQDTDGVIRFDRLADLEREGMMTVSLTAGARVRWKFEECSFRMPQYDPDPARVESINYLNINKWKDESNDMAAIDAIKEVIENSGEKGIVQGELIKKVSEENGIGRNTAGEKAKQYAGRHWIRIRKADVGGIKYIYKMPQFAV